MIGLGCIESCSNCITYDTHKRSDSPIKKVILICFIANPYAKAIFNHDQEKNIKVTDSK